MKKNNAWNIRCLVNESFVPASHRASVLYCRLSDFTWQFRKVSLTPLVWVNSISRLKDVWYQGKVGQPHNNMVVALVIIFGFIVIYYIFFSGSSNMFKKYLLIICKFHNPCYSTSRIATYYNFFRTRTS